MTGPQTHRPPRFGHALLRTIALTATAVAVLSSPTWGSRRDWSLWVFGAVGRSGPQYDDYDGSVRDLARRQLL